LTQARQLLKGTTQGPEPHPATTTDSIKRCPRCAAAMKIGPNLTGGQLARRCNLLRQFLAFRPKADAPTCNCTPPHPCVCSAKLSLEAWAGGPGKRRRRLSCTAQSLSMRRCRRFTRGGQQYQVGSSIHRSTRE
jgi:hypothetical protein